MASRARVSVSVGMSDALRNSSTVSQRLFGWKISFSRSNSPRSSEKSSRRLAGTPTSTAITGWLVMARITSTGRLLRIPPSRYIRSSLSTGGSTPGMALLASSADTRSPSPSTRGAAESMAVAVTRRGIARSSKVSGSLSRRNASIRWLPMRAP